MNLSIFHRAAGLLLLVALLLPATAGAATRSPLPGFDAADPGAVAGLITPCEEGIYTYMGLISAAPPNSTSSREHVRISSHLATTLGIAPSDVHANGEENPQIRVVLENFEIDGLVSSAVFTVSEIVPLSINRLWVYPRAASSSSTFYKNSGEYKLFADQAISVTSARLRVFRMAPSSSWIERPEYTQAISSYCEPEPLGSHYFREQIRLRSDKRFALLVPHGGGIELHTSAQITPVVERLSQDHSVEANVWENVGQWGDGQTFARWHVTSAAFDRHSFPGLDLLLDEPDFVTGRPFQYAAALHGEGSSSKRIILGGDSHMTEKCYLVDRIRNRLGSRAGEVSFYLFDVSDNAANDRKVPANASIDRDDVDHLRGLDNQNVVNRLSPNTTGVAGRGAFQLEQSSGLRNDSTLRVAVAEGLADAIGDLVSTGVPSGFSCSDLP